MRRSAAAMSGRRSSSAEGTPTGMGGGVVASGATGSEKVDAGCPRSRAIACSVCTRATPTSMASACVVLSWVSACTTSTREATPLARRFRVSCSALANATTVSSSSRFWASSMRSW